MVLIPGHRRPSLRSLAACGGDAARRRLRPFDLGIAQPLVRSSWLFGAGADLPGHGRSPGKPLPTIAGMADWTAALLDAGRCAEGEAAGHPWGR